MAWIRIGRDNAHADLTVTGPSEVVAELPYDRNSARMIRNARVGHFAVITDDEADIEGTVTEVDEHGYGVRVEARRPW